MDTEYQTHTRTRVFDTDRYTIFEVSMQHTRLWNQTPISKTTLAALLHLEHSVVID